MEVDAYRCTIKVESNSIGPNDTHAHHQFARLGNHPEVKPSLTMYYSLHHRDNGSPSSLKRFACMQYCAMYFATHMWCSAVSRPLRRMGLGTRLHVACSSKLALTGGLPSKCKAESRQAMLQRRMVSCIDGQSTNRRYKRSAFQNTSLFTRAAAKRPFCLMTSHYV